MEPMWAAWLGRMAYAPSLDVQRAIAARRANGEVPDVLVLLEHDAVYTLGRRAGSEDVLLDAAALAARGIEVAQTDRGGLATYHGPGQLVGYPIVDLGAGADLPGYVAALERALIAAVTDLGVSDATTVPGHRGVWVGDEKLAAIGVHVSRGITTHGFALNVSCDLDAFSGIVPCGIVDRGVTSIDALTGHTPPLPFVAKRVANRVAEALGRALFWRAPDVLTTEAGARA